MPKIKRWFPVSHDFLDDPEVAEMREKFGDRSVFVWMRMLSWGDRHEGKLTGEAYQIAASFGRDYDPIHPRSAANRASILLRWMEDRRWIEPISGGYLIRNYAEFHRARGRNRLPPSEPSEPSEPKESETAPPAIGKKKRVMPEAIKRAADPLYRQFEKKFEEQRIIAWIWANEKNYKPAVIAAALTNFLPFAATVEKWWPYLDKLLFKAQVRDREAEHEKLKKETVPEQLRGLIGSIGK